jgi:stearoyl-CoA desaturase (delta-9 desaturase)
VKDLLLSDCLWLISKIFSDWDPTKWIIWVLHRYTPFVPTIAITPEGEILKARAHVHRLHADRLTSQIPSSDIAKDDAQLPQWSKANLVRELEADEGAVFLLIDGYIVDVGGYLDVHVSPPSVK